MKSLFSFDNEMHSDNEVFFYNTLKLDHTKTQQMSGFKI